MPYRIRSGQARALVPPPLPLWERRHYHDKYRGFYSAKTHSSFPRRRDPAILSPLKLSRHVVFRKRMASFKGRPLPSRYSRRPEGVQHFQEECEAGERRTTLRKAFDGGIGYNCDFEFKWAKRLHQSLNEDKECGLLVDQILHPGVMNEDLCSQPSMTKDALTLKVDMKEFNSSPTANNTPLGYTGVWSKRDADSLSQLYTETRIDRYGKSATVKRCFPDIQSNRDLFPSLERKTPARSVSKSEESDFSARRLRLKSLLDVPTSSSSPQQSLDGHGLASDSTEGLSPQKRPRLGWGQGLAQYEKKVVGKDICGTSLRIDFPGSGMAEGRISISSPVEDASVLTDSSPTATHPANLFAETSVHNFQLDGTSVWASPFICMSEDCGSSDATFRKTTFLQRNCSSIPISLSERHITNCSKGEMLQCLEKVEREIDSLEKELQKLDHDEHFFEESCIKQEPLDMQSESVVADADVNLLAEASTENQDTINNIVSDLDFIVDASAKLLSTHALPPEAPKCLNQNVLGENKVFSEAKHANEIQGTEQSVGCLGVQDKESDKLSLEPVLEQAQSDQRFVTEILTTNRERAKEASESLSHLLPRNSDSGNSEVLYHKPSESPFWKDNTDSYEMLKSSIVGKILSHQQDRRFKERILAVKYWYSRESWKKEVLLMQQRRDRHKRLKSLRSGLSPVRFASEELIIPKGIVNGGSQQNCQKVSLKMPAMTIDEKPSLGFPNQNGLVVDPIATENERSRINPWTLEEKQIFYDKFIVFNKDFRSIASFLAHKSVADCVQFYYLHQKSDEFEKIKQARTMQNYSHLKSSYMAGRSLRTDRYYNLNSACMKQFSNIVATPRELSACTGLIFKNEFKTSQGFGSHVTPNVDHSKLVSVEAGSPCQSSATTSNWCGKMQYKDGYMLRPIVKSCILGYPVEVDRSKTISVQHESAKGSPSSNSQWTDGEKQLFVAAISIYGKDFKNIALHVGSKSESQCKAFFSKTRKRLRLDNLLENWQMRCSETAVPGADDLQVSASEEVLLQAKLGQDVKACQKLTGSRDHRENYMDIDEEKVVDINTMEEVHLSETNALRKMCGMKENAVVPILKAEKEESEWSICQIPAAEVKSSYKQEREAEPLGVTKDMDSKVEEEIQASSDRVDDMQCATLHDPLDASKSDWKVMHENMSILGDASVQRQDEKEVKVENGHRNLLSCLLGSGGSNFDAICVDQSDAMEPIEASQDQHHPRSCRTLSDAADSETSKSISYTCVKSELYDSAEGNLQEMVVEVSGAKERRGSKKRGSSTRNDNAKRSRHPATSKLSGSHLPFPITHSLACTTSGNVLPPPPSQQQDMLIQQIILPQQQLQSAIPLLSYTQSAVLQHDKTAKLMARNMQLESQIMQFQHHEQQQRLMRQKHNQRRQNVQCVQEHGIQGHLYLQKAAESGYQHITQQEVLDQCRLLNEKGQGLQQINHLQDALTSEKEQRVKQEELTMQPCAQEYQIIFDLLKPDTYNSYPTKSQPDVLVTLQRQQQEKMQESKAHCSDLQSHFGQIGNHFKPIFGDRSQTGHQQPSGKATVGFEYVDNASWQRTGTGDIKLFGRSLLSSSPSVIKGSGNSGCYSLLSNKQDLCLSKCDDQQQETQNSEVSLADAANHLAETCSVVDNMTFGENRLGSYTSRHVELPLAAQQLSSDTVSRVVNEMDCDIRFASNLTLPQGRDCIPHNNQAKHDSAYAVRESIMWPLSTSNAYDRDVLAPNSYVLKHEILQNQPLSENLQQGNCGQLFY